MGYIAGLITGGICFTKKESKLAYLLAGVYAWILFGFNTNNLDYANYKGRFEGAGGAITEPVFLFILKVFRKLGFRYQSFLCVYAAVCLILLSVIIIKYSPYPAAVFFLYLVFPFCLDTVQIRFFLASSIVLVALCLILKYKTNKKLLYIAGFVLLVGLATGIHYSAALYMIFIVLFLDEKRAGFILYCLIPAAMLAGCAALPHIPDLLGAFIGMDKANAWLGSLEVASMTRVIRLVMIRGGLLFLCLIAKHLPWREDVRFDESGTAAQVDDGLLLLTLYSLLFTIFEAVLGSSYERLTRPGLLTGLIYISRKISLTDKKTRTLMWILMAGLVLLNFYAALFLGINRGGTNFFESVFLNMFRNNAVF